MIYRDDNWGYESRAFCTARNTEAGIDLYRFYSPVYGAHFYTTSVIERDKLINNDPNWLAEGVAYQVLED